MHLTKHHGLGNDFLVLIGEPSALAEVDAPVARHLCDRHRGIGADGLMVATLPQDQTPSGAGSPDLTMVLYNSDGSRAELSGNGLRCLAQAEAMRRGVDSAVLQIGTDAGLRRCEVHPRPEGGDPHTVQVSVDMGEASPGPAASRDVAADDSLGLGPEDLHRLGLDAKRAATIDLGNPHLVLEVPEPHTVDVGAAGPLYESAYAGGINVHFVAVHPGATDTLTMQVWERGAGITQACGTGACAAAVAARDWDLVGSPVTVEMPGGSVTVSLTGNQVTLIGPATFVADIDVEW